MSKSTTMRTSRDFDNDDL